MSNGTGKARMTDHPQPCCKNYAPTQALACQQSGRAPNIQITSGSSQRNDGKEPIQLFYRLRGYSSPGQTATGEGVFEVEGIVKREGANAADDYLARTLLTRSLYVQSIVAAEDDWGVMAGHHLELADSKITDHFDNTDGSGMILINEDEDRPTNQQAAAVLQPWPTEWEAPALISDSKFGPRSNEGCH